eukprot:TRINITY_DN29813_c0_g1_i1.p2 TRINITY_DN29813_c0_g1~~TRINITY_DN29813_c0_g1_i1.p2  ORF type:complete len:100 (+),score=3.29 TRINITY_DN29813_c0_g1_i1:98-397(+)
MTLPTFFHALPIMAETLGRVISTATVSVFPTFTVNFNHREMFEDTLAKVTNTGRIMNMLAFFISFTVSAKLALKGCVFLSYWFETPLGFPYFLGTTRDA